MIQTGNHTEAEDLAQETFLKAFRAMDAFRTGISARAWLLTILRNTGALTAFALPPARCDISVLMNWPPNRQGRIRSKTQMRPGEVRKRH